MTPDMKPWQQAAADRVAAVGSATSQEDFEKVVALGGWPATEMDEGCPVLFRPTGFTRDPQGPRCGVKVGRGKYKGQRCHQPAGQGTAHLGAGRCVAHGGAKQDGRAEASWMVSHAFARELDVSPWEGLLRAVRIAAGKVAYCEWVLSTASDDLELEGRFGRNDEGILLHPDTGEPMGAGQLRNLSWWVTKSELWTERMARYSKMAIDGGVAERLVQTIELEAQGMARVLGAALGELEGVLDDNQMAQVRSRMRSELLAIEAEAQRPVVQA